MTEHRWSKFWWQDWQSDQALRSCSLASRGLWMDMLCIAHAGTPRGHVTINGSAVSAKRLAILAGCSLKECTILLNELREAGVFNETPEGVIYSRRMVRDNDASEAGREAIGKRWIKRDDPISPPIRSANSPPTTLEAEAESEKKEPSLRSGRAQDEADAPRPDGWEGQWRRTRVSDTNPRAVGDNPRSQGARLPDDWKPDEPAFAGCGQTTLAKFRDYWRAQPGAKGRKADWQATWRNWCRRDAEQPKPKLHTLPPAEQDRRILAAVGLQFDDHPRIVQPPIRIAQ